MYINPRLTSIIICALNHLKDLTIPCINSVIQNTREPYELILVDDGSQDATFQYFRSLTQKAFRNSTPKGVANCRNIGVINSIGRYIATLDNDVIVPPGWLTVLIQESRKYKVGIVGAMLSNETWRHNLPVSPDGLCDVVEMAGACMLIKREVFERVGLFNENLINCAEDTDFCFRAKIAGYRVVNTPRLMVYHRWHGTRKDFNQKQMQESLTKFQKLWYNYRHSLPVMNRGL